MTICLFRALFSPDLLPSNMHVWKEDQKRKRKCVFHEDISTTPIMLQDFLLLIKFSCEHIENAPPPRVWPLRVRTQSWCLLSITGGESGKELQVMYLQEAGNRWKWPVLVERTPCAEAHNFLSSQARRPEKRFRGNRRADGLLLKS